MKIIEWIASIAHDLRYAVRTYTRSPGWTIVALLSLGLGIGANVAVFTLLDTILLRKLPVPNPDELVAVAWRGNRLISFPLYRELRERQQVFTDIFAVGGLTQRITIPATNGPATELDNTSLATVTSSYFSVLGLKPAIGRFFTAEDEQIPQSSETTGSVVVLSDGLWDRVFGRDPGVLGRTIMIGRSPCSIIGVAPRDFSGISVGTVNAAWVPIVPFTANDMLEARGAVFNGYMARLRPGVDRVQAEYAMNALFRQLLVAEARGEVTDNNRIILPPAPAGQMSDLRRTYATPLWIVMGVVILVHLIACANIANLLLARGASRRSEIGVRLAIGCSRLRLIRQLLTESLILSLSGTIVGIGFAYWGSRFLVRMIDFGQSPIQLDFGPDWRILLFLAAIGILTGLVFGLVPAFRTTRSNLAQAVQGSGRSDAALGSRQRLSRVVVAFQVAVSLLLAVTAGLLIQTIYKLHRLDKGFRTENVILFDLASNSTRRLTPEVLVQIARDAPARIQQLPGIESASVTAPLSPFQRQSSMYSPLLIPGAERTMVLYSSVSPGYLETMGIQLVAGRDIEERDTETAPLVTVINESMARRFFPEGAVGRIVHNSPGPAPPAAATGVPGPPIEIIGVVRDTKYNDLREKETMPLFYVPVRQRAMPLRSLVVRTREPLASIEPAVRQALLEVNRDLMIRRTVTLSDQVAQSFSAELMIMRLCVFFGGLALLLACVGLYGTMSYAVTQRKGEIGIRMALGATQKSVLRLVLGESFVVVLAGVVVALPMTFLTTRLVRGFLYDVTPTDPATMALATAVLLAAAALAAFLPARRASRVDPMTALRQY